jgi:hypothetical protein
MKTPVPPLQPGSTADTFRLVGWQVFAPGFHKGQLYTPADCAATVRNFGLLSTGDAPALRVKAKFGHDAEQRIARSLGVMNAGLVTDCRRTPDGGFALDVDGIPATLMVPDANTGEPVAFDLKAAFENGNICDGSVELVWGEYADPANPTQKLAGPVLEAVAFLGEERPGVGGLPPPVASFSARPDRSTNHAPRPTRRRVVFSEVDPMPTRDELLQQLTAAGVDVSDPQVTGMADEALFGLLKSVPSEAFGAAMKKKYAADPTPPPPPASKPDDAVAQLAASFQKFSDDLGHRVGAMEQAFQALQGPAMQAAQFAADFQATAADQQKRIATETVDRAINEGRLLPYAREAVLADLMKCGNGRKEVFAAGHAQAGRTPFQAACADLLARPVTHQFSDTPEPLVTDDTLTDFERRALDATPTGKKVARSLAAE